MIKPLKKKKKKLFNKKCQQNPSLPQGCVAQLLELQLPKSEIAPLILTDCDISYSDIFPIS